MDVRSTGAAYVSKMVKTLSGVKALVLDDETSRIVAVVASQSDLFRQDVFLTERLGTKHDIPLSHLAAIVFVRPSAENLRALRSELHNPAFGSYYIVFSNVVRPSYLEEIADADESHVVSLVHEIYADFFALDSHLFSLNVSPCLDSVLGAGVSTPNPNFERTVDGIVASLLALKRRPVVRYQGSSSLCRNLAERVAIRMDQEASLFTFRAQQTPALLLLLDRCEDPVTPLLNQWTYEAMVHELIGIENNRVSLAKAPNIPDDLQDIVLDVAIDDFFRQNRYQNFGELGINLKKLVDSFHAQTQSHSSLASIDDMMRFVGNYPEFRKTMSTVGKHVALSSELSRLVEKHDLLKVSQLEQDIACREAEAEHRKLVSEMLANSKVTPSDKLRLVMLYSLRYEESPSIRKVLSQMVNSLHIAGVGSDGVHLISNLKEYAGSRKRSGDVFSNRSFFAMASNTVRRGIGGVENVYTQHEPLLSYTLDELLRGRLKCSSFPSAAADDDSINDGFSGGSGRAADSIGLSGGISEEQRGDATPRGVGVGTGNSQGSSLAPNSATSPIFVPPPKETIVFIAGGVSYEESKCVSGINGGPFAFTPPEGSVTASAHAAAKATGARVILGGTHVSNSSSFALEIARTAAAASSASARREERVF